MGSTFTWLDHSESDRQRVLEAIDRFKETETRDELGLGAIRDGFANELFPATSTIQTRAAYFLFVPWIYRQLEERGVEAPRVAKVARAEEMKLLRVLKASPEKDDQEGLLGKQAGDSLKRLPSSVYWAGLGTLGIRSPITGSQSQYHRSFGRLLQRRLSNFDEEGSLVDSGGATWHPNLPEPPQDFPEGAHFHLRRSDAEYLEQRILHAAPKSLLAWLVRAESPVPDVSFPWLHPERETMPERIRSDLELARHFSEVMHGAALLYNFMLAEQLQDTHPRKAEFHSEYEAKLQAWATELTEIDSSPSRWDLKAFWYRVSELRIPFGRVKTFVEGWVSLAPWTSLKAATGKAARELIHSRELELKRSRSRLGNPGALERWNGSAGAAQLDFRWGPALRLLRDIEAGLGKEAIRARAG